MTGLDGYSLLDFGRGRRLERFGEVLVDRPAPVAERDEPLRHVDWATAGARFVRESPGRRDAGRVAEPVGHWIIASPLPEPWLVRRGQVALELRPMERGQIGVFAEQAPAWTRLERALGGKRDPGAPPRSVLHLFAHTGAATLVGAAAGGAMVHVDSARGALAWARRNAELSGLADAPIRWIVDDAVTFARRELRRGRRYDGVVLDPPAYGHGSGGRSWQLERDLPALLRDCAELISGRRGFLIVTAHSPTLDRETLGGAVVRAVDAVAAERAAHGRPFGRLETEILELVTGDGRRLPSGILAAWTALR